ncbi:MAG: DUF2510 domain-containing protein [Acidimicrobiales bacterium]
MGLAENPPAGWYPQEHGLERYWDGEVWTEHTRPAVGSTSDAGPAASGQATVAIQPTPTVPYPGVPDPGSEPPVSAPTTPYLDLPQPGSEPPAPSPADPYAANPYPSAPAPFPAPLSPAGQDPLGAYPPAAGPPPPANQYPAAPYPPNQYPPVPYPGGQYPAPTPPGTVYPGGRQQGYAASAAYGTPRRRDPALALLCSFFIPGLGSAVAGDGAKGFVIFLLWLASFVIGTILLFLILPVFFPLGVWIYSMVDAYNSARRWNAARGIYV